MFRLVPRTRGRGCRSRPDHAVKTGPAGDARSSDIGQEPGLLCKSCIERRHTGGLPSTMGARALTAGEWRDMEASSGQDDACSSTTFHWLDYG
jgi:hypothetical protein